MIGIFSFGGWVAKLTVDGFTNLGADSPAIKQKYITATMPAVGSNVSVPIGVDSNKIIGSSVLVPNSAGTLVPPSYSGTGAETNSYYTYLLENTDCVLITGSVATAVAGQPAKIFVTYTE